MVNQLIQNPQIGQARWHACNSSTLCMCKGGRQKQEREEFKVIFVYSESMRLDMRLSQKTMNTETEYTI